MKKTVLLISLFFTVFIFNGIAFNGIQTSNDPPKIGDVLVINEPTGQTYNHIYFPRLNFIIKRGGVANYKSIYGKQVVVREVNTKKDGTVQVQLEPQNENKFFGFLKKVKADYNQAVNSGELSVL